MGDPKTYWEERAAATEGALMRLAAIVGTALPHVQEQIGGLMCEWNRIKEDIHKEYSGQVKAG